MPVKRSLASAAGLALLLATADPASADNDLQPMIDAARDRGQWTLVALLYGRLIDESRLTGEALADLHRARAEAYQAAGNLDAAFDDCESAIELAPRYPKGYDCRGEIALDMGDVDGALADLDHAIALDPGFPESYHLRAIALMQVGDYGQALSDLDTAIGLGLATAATYADRCASQYNMGHFALAEADCREAIAIDPAYGWTYNNLALLHWQQNDLDSALAALDQAIGALPDERVPLRNRAGVYYERGAFDLAIADQTALLAGDPDDPYTLANLGYALVATGDLDEGEAMLEDALAASRGDPWVYGLLGHAFLEAGEYGDAIAAFQRGWDDQGDGALIGGIALGLAYLGDRSSLDRVADTIVRVATYSQIARQHLARAYYEIGEPELALRHLDAALATAPGVAGTYHVAGLILTELGLGEEALADFDRAIVMGGTSRIRQYYRRLQALGYELGTDETVRDEAFDEALKACVAERCRLERQHEG